MVPMRDGVRLATDIAYPNTGTGPWPVLLMRTCYGRDVVDCLIADECPQYFDGRDGHRLLEAGFAIASQETRGRGQSEGGPTCWFMTDGWWGDLRDGYDAIEWLAAQPWCDGNVGTMGLSALGITQYLAAGAAPPHLRAAHASVAAADLYWYTARHPGGALHGELVTFMRDMGLTQKCLDTFSMPPSRYADFWSPRRLEAVAHEVGIPIIHRGGWFDFFSQGTIDAFVLLQHRGGPGARGRQKLVMGPWGHDPAFVQEVGELVFPANAASAPDIDMVPWFGQWMKGEERGVPASPAVHYYVMGDVDDPESPGNAWHSADDWPVPSEATPLYLHADGALAFAAPAETGERTFTYDPADPVPTHGGVRLYAPYGPMDQGKYRVRPDVLVFCSAPLDEPVLIAGRVRARLWASSSCVDTDFTVKLMDTYPDGRAMVMADGVVRARFRHRGGPDLIAPGEIYELEIDLYSTALVFNRGHRFEVHVSSSNHPRYDVNPNTGGDYVEGGETRIAVNTVYVGADRPSHLLLPVVPLSP